MENADNNTSSTGEPHATPAAGTRLNTTLDRRDIERIEFLNKPRDLRAFLRSAAKLLSPLGFSNFAFLLARPDTDDIQKLWPYPELSREFYIERGLHRSDLNIKHCLASNTPINQLTIKDYVCSSPVENEQLAMNREISLKLEELGFSDYFAFGFDPQHGDSRAIFSFSSRGAPPGVLKQRALSHMDEIRKIAHAVDHVGSNKHGMAFMHGRGQGIIPNAPLKLLDIMANDNVNLQDAAKIMNITVGTANIHVRTIKAAFQVPTITRAAVEALNRGLIFRRPKNI